VKADEGIDGCWWAESPHDGAGIYQAEVLLAGERIIPVKVDQAAEARVESGSQQSLYDPRGGRIPDGGPEDKGDAHTSQVRSHDGSGPRVVAGRDGITKAFQWLHQVEQARPDPLGELGAVPAKLQEALSCLPGDASQDLRDLLKERSNQPDRHTRLANGTFKVIGSVGEGVGSPAEKFQALRQVRPPDGSRQSDRLGDIQ
jgi:hypothetical protein